MTVTEALGARASVRAFLERPVAGELIGKILEDAGRSPSGGNLQPWHVFALTGDDLAQFKARIAERAAELPGGEDPVPPIYPNELGEPYRTRRFKNGEDLYATLGISREEKGLRLKQLARNYCFFDAPVGLLFTINRQMEARQWIDLGIYLQSVMLLAHEHGLGTCPQAAWARWHATIGEFLELPDSQLAVCGMAIGYADVDAPINALRTDRAVPAEYIIMRGF